MTLDPNGGELQSALDITLRRFAEFQNLQGAFGRRAIIEQAKGILMERNGIDAEAAFALLKSHSQQTGQKLFDVAQAITQNQQLLSVVNQRTSRRPPDSLLRRFGLAVEGKGTTCQRDGPAIA